MVTNHAVPFPEDAAEELLLVLLLDEAPLVTVASRPNARPYVAWGAMLPVAAADWTTFVRVAVAVRY